MENTNRHYPFDVTDDLVRLKYGKLMSKRYINDCFREAYPVEYNWLLKNYGSFQLARGIYNYMTHQGRITSKQLNAIRNFVFRN
jgi:hypothetical protein